MKKLALFISALIIVVAAVITCPGKQAHSDALMKVANAVIDSEIYGSDSLKTQDYQGWDIIGSLIGSKVANSLIDRYLNVSNYFVCSIGTVIYKDHKKVVSVGVFNHVFTASEHQVKDFVEQSLDYEN